MAQKFFNRYNPKPIIDGSDFRGHDEVCNQQASDEVELIKMLNDFAEGNISELPVVREPIYNDVLITPKSFEEAKALIDKVKNDFYTLPKETQRKFGNIETYVQDTCAMAQGNPVTLAKYSNMQVSPVKTQDVNSASEGISSSSISRGDNGSVSNTLKASEIDGSVAQKG